MRAALMILSPRAKRVVAGCFALAACGASVLIGTGPAASATSASTPNGTDTGTEGGWSLGSATSRSYAYGTFGYVLPDANGANEYGIGGQLTTNPSLDETGGPGFGDAGYTGEKATYAVHGPIQPDARTLELPGGTQRRATACFGGSVSVNLPLAAGDYQIAVYAVDYDRDGRIEATVNSASSASATQTIANFANGVYALYTVHTDGSAAVSITTSAMAGPNAVVSGVFVDRLSSPTTGVQSVGADTATQGNWIGHYGSAGYLLCGINAGAVGSPQSWSPSLDASSGLGTYNVIGNVYAWTNTFTSGPITEPAYAYAWNSFQSQSSTDVGSATFWKNNTFVGGPTTPGMRRATTWDSGDDIWGTTGRPLQIDLHVPANSSSAKSGFQVAFYFRDYDNNRTEHFALNDVTHGTAVDSQMVSNFAGGIYYRYLVPAETDLQLTATDITGVNALLNGIFLDEVPAPPAGCATPSSIASNFNGTAIPTGDNVWFSSVAKVSGLPSSGGTISFTARSVTFAANGTTHTATVPATTVTFSPSVTQATTSYDATANEWTTTVPTSYSGNVFIGGMLLPSGSGLPGGINPVTWSGTFHVPAGVSVNWQWAAAVYTSAPSGLGAVGAKPIDGSTANPYANSDHAGTPEAIKAYVTGGARGGGGSNWTGSYSATAAVSC